MLGAKYRQILEENNKTETKEDNTTINFASS